VPAARADDTTATATAAAQAPDSGSPPATLAKPQGRLRRWLRRPTSLQSLWMLVLVLAALLTWSVSQQLGQRRITQQDIDAAVLKTLETQELPSEYAKAYDAIRPSVVRVAGYIKRERLQALAKGKPGAGPAGRATPGASGPKAPPSVDEDEGAQEGEVRLGVGTGVVIVDKGLILTNLHVVSGADRITVTFADGLEATASVVNVQPQNDLAVLQAHKIPDDLFAATMKGTGELAPGDKVMAVGFPFGIGPSASGGVVSGLGRAFRSPEGGHSLRNLIQFDAAANPGNSGGPLVTMDGAVVGIVTAILNPTSARTFLGIGFAVPIENAASAVGVPPF
jgi:S1-C subfamily serine protease